MKRKIKITVEEEGKITETHEVESFLLTGVYFPQGREVTSSEGGVPARIISHVSINGYTDFVAIANDFERTLKDALEAQEDEKNTH